MASNASKIMCEYPIALQWTIAEDRLKTLKDSTNDEYLESDKFAAFHGSDVKYFLRIYPSGNKDSQQRKTWLFLYLELGNEKKIESEFTLSIKSAEWSRKLDKVFETSTSWGVSCCTSNELFNPNKKFIDDGKFIVQVEGTLKIEKTQSKQKMKLHDLWDIGFKDFTIVADGKEIAVHKNVLACQSHVFSAMLKPHTKEANESKVEIPDFTFDIVEKAVKYCYQQVLLPDTSVEESFLLLKFADKYDISILKENLEEYLVEKITVSNVCEIAKGSDAGNSVKLRNQCLDFITNCVSQKTFLPNMELLDNAFMLSIFNNHFCHESQTI